MFASFPSGLLTLRALAISGKKEVDNYVSFGMRDDVHTKSPQNWVRYNDIADMLKIAGLPCSARTLRRFVARHGIRAWRVNHRVVFFWRPEIEAALASILPKRFPFPRGRDNRSPGRSPSGRIETKTH
jgi:hypothetical protein